MAKLRKPSNDEKAAAHVKAAIDLGAIVKSFGPDGDFTAGPYTKAVGPQCFALFGYGKRVPEPYQAREGDSALVARLFVSCVGSTRARDAALRAMPKKPTAGPVAKPAAARKPPSKTFLEAYRRRGGSLLDHVRSGCRRLFCPVCG